MSTSAVLSPAPSTPTRAARVPDQAYGVVLGCPRSGTTFLSRVLETVPEFESITGTLLPVAVPHVVNHDLPPAVYDALAVGFERALDAYLHSGRYLSKTATLKKWMAAPTGIAGLYRALTKERPLPRRLIYKEPFLSMAPEFVLDALPDGKIVHIYRDGRDVANSLVRTYDVLTDERLRNLKGSEMRLGRPYDDRFVPWWVDQADEDEFMAASPYVRSIWMWRYVMQRCHDAFARPEVKARGNVMLLQYESFMQDPVAYGRAVIDHLGGTPTRATERLLANAHTRSIGKHSSRANAEVDRAEAIARDVLDLYGYE